MHVSISAKSEERQIKNMKHWVKAIRGWCLCLVTCSSELVTQRKLSYSLCCLYDSFISPLHIQFQPWVKLFAVELEKSDSLKNGKKQNGIIFDGAVLNTTEPLWRDRVNDDIAGKRPKFSGYLRREAEVVCRAKHGANQEKNNLCNPGKRMNQKHLLFQPQK